MPKACMLSSAGSSKSQVIVLRTKMSWRLLDVSALRCSGLWQAVIPCKFFSCPFCIAVRAIMRLFGGKQAHFRRLQGRMVSVTTLCFMESAAEQDL